MFAAKKILKVAGLSVLALIVIGVSILAITGLPQPPSITAQNVPRISWKWVWRSVGMVKQFQASASFAAWYPSKRQMLIYKANRIHRIARAGAEPEVLKALPQNASMIKFNPNSDKPYFVFSLDEGGSELYRLYRYDLPGNTYQPLTQQAARTYGLRFTVNGDKIAYTSARRNGSDFDIYLVNPDDPESEEMIYQANGAFHPVDWSPGAEKMLVYEYLSMTNGKLHLFDWKHHEMRRLLPAWGDSVSFETAFWSRDGNHIHFISDHGAEFSRIHRYNVATGEVTALTSDIPWDINDFALSPDETHMVMLVNREGIPQLQVIDLRTRRFRHVAEQPDGYITNLNFHLQRNEVAFNVTAPSGITSVYSYDLQAEELVKWTNPNVEENALLPATEVIHYPTFDSLDGKPRMISAFLMRAPDTFKGPRPVLIDIHGGPAAQASPILNPGYQMVWRLGITAIVPNVRGSTGYGKTFAALDNGKLRENAVRDIGALLDWIEKQPDLDASRVGITGGSYGGYMALASLVHYSSRVRCGMDMFGISNFITFLEASKESHFPEVQRAEYGDERDPEMRAFLESISPLHHADKITVPLIIYQGRNDVRVKVKESRQMVEQIRAHGGKVLYIEAADEGHSLSQPLNQLYVGAAGLQILEDYLLQK